MKTYILRDTVTGFELGENSTLAEAERAKALLGSDVEIVLLDRESFYWLIDERNGDFFEEKLTATTEAEAIATARSEWDRLSAHDKKLRDSFELIFTPEAEGQDFADYNLCRLILKLK